MTFIQPDYFIQRHMENNEVVVPLHSYDLRPDKLIHFHLGLSTGPEGWYDSVYMTIWDQKVYKWVDVAWEIEDKVYFWLSLHTNDPVNLNVSGVHTTIVDQTPGPQCYGYGPLWETKTFKSLDQTFEYVRSKPLLQKFFFPNGEDAVLRLNHYVSR